MALTIPEEVLETARMSEAELRVEIAVLLFSTEKLTLGQAAHLAEMDRSSFQHLLASRKISPHYDISELEEDLATLDRLAG